MSNLPPSADGAQPDASSGAEGDSSVPPVVAELARPAPQESDELTWSAEALEIRPLDDGVRQRPRLWMLPLLLFLATCVCTFWVGASNWMPTETLESSPDWLMGVRQAIVSHWQQGLTYMACVLAILLAHEMGHYLTSRWYGISASLPFFIPFPSPIGTMGAVIAMDGMRANRREMFDIGLAGPLAGLVVTVPILWIGVSQLQLGEPGRGFGYDAPLVVRWILAALPPQGYDGDPVVYTNQMNPYYAAGWVGLFITGLNMFPVSQLDGGHVAYTLFGTAAHWLARIFMMAAFVAMVIGNAMLLLPMAVLVTLLGIDHPPTADDEEPLGTFRTVLGILSLAIPFLCFPPRLLLFDG